MDTTRSIRTLIAITLLLAAVFVAMNNSINGVPVGEWLLAGALFLLGIGFAVAAWYETRPARVPMTPIGRAPNEPDEAVQADTQARSDAIAASVQPEAARLTMATEAPGEHLENINVDEHVTLADVGELSAPPSDSTEPAAETVGAGAGIGAGGATPSGTYSTEPTDASPLKPDAGAAAPPQLAKAMASEGTDIAAAKNIDVTESPGQSPAMVTPPPRQSVQIETFNQDAQNEPSATPTETEVQQQNASTVSVTEVDMAEHTEPIAHTESGTTVRPESAVDETKAPDEPTTRDDAPAQSRDTTPASPSPITTPPVEQSPASPATSPAAQVNADAGASAAPSTEQPASTAGLPEPDVDVRPDSPKESDDTQQRSDAMASTVTAEATQQVPAEAPPVENINTSGFTDKDAGEIGGSPTATVQQTPASPAPDDLTVIDGVGFKFAAALKDAGFDTFDKLAAASSEQITAAVQAAGLRRPGSIGTWAEQAGFAARGDWDGLTAFKATLDGGRRRN